jgi:hypothetical protein
VVPAPTAPTVAVTAAAPSSAATELAPTATPEPSLDQDGLPPTTTTGWWGDPDSPHECARPGSYRIGYRVAGLGDCNGMFNEGPPTVTLDVGEDFDLHMTIPADGALPIWPLPEAADPLVADSWLITDNATMTYRGLTPGTTRLVTKGACFRGSAAAVPVPAADGICPVLVIDVRMIETKCIDLPDDLCRAAGAAAVRIAGGQPGQRIVGWVAEPATLKIEWPGCGHVVAKVTLDLRDPDGKDEITLGQPQPDTHPLGLAWCTY